MITAEFDIRKPSKSQEVVTSDYIHCVVCMRVCACVSVSVRCECMYENTGAMQLSNPDKCPPGQL